MLSSPHVSAKRLWDKIPAYIKVTFFSAIAIGLLVHLYMFTNKLPNHDDLQQLFDNMVMTTSGRWFLSVPAAISSSFSLPWVGGCLSVLYLSVSSCFIAACFRIRKTLYCILTSALVVSFPTVACTLTYMNCADAYFFAVMLMCAAVYFADRYRFGFLAGVVLVTLSLGIYQSYFSLACGLSVGVLIIGILGGKATPKETVIKGVKLLAMLAFGILAYFIIVKITLAGQALTPYMGIDQMGQISLSELPGLIITAYRQIVRFYITDWFNLHDSWLRILFLLMGVGAVALVVCTAVRNKVFRYKSNYFLLGALLALFLLAINIIYVMAPDVHMLMLYGLVLLPVAVIALMELAAEESGCSNRVKLVQRVSCWVITAVIALASFNYAVVNNKGYLKLDLVNRETYAYANRLLTQMQSAAGYTTDTAAVFIGRTDLDRFGDPLPETKKLESMTGFTRLIDLIRDPDFPSYLKAYLGYTPTIYSRDTEIAESFAAREEVQAMPCYPDDGSIRMIDGFLVVKLGEPGV